MAHLQLTGHHQFSALGASSVARLPHAARLRAAFYKCKSGSRAQQRRAARDLLVVQASKNNNNNNSSSDDNDNEPSTSGSGSSSSTGIPAVLLLLVSSAAWTVTNLRDELGDVLADDDGLADITLLGLGPGDLFGAVLWSVALWYSSPWQLLLVFLGRFETERPSDWIMNNIGRAAQLPVDSVDYVAPAWVKAAAACSCALGGLTMAATLGFGLGDPTWAVSSGIGALFAAAVFEAGRPKRLSVAEAQQLEAQWQDFAAFADRKLQRSGRCHESEVFTAFRRSNAKYRSADALPDNTLRDMVRNWHPGVERTRTGYLRNLSLQPVPGVVSSSSSSSSDGVVVAAGKVAADSSSQAAGASSGSALLDNIVQASIEADSD